MVAPARLPVLLPSAGDRQRVVGYAAFAFHEAADHG
jgi:hypothetical protein